MKIVKIEHDENDKFDVTLTDANQYEIHMLYQLLEGLKQKFKSPIMGEDEK